MKKNIFLLFIVLSFIFRNESLAQYNGNIWVFGDSAGINFKSNTTPIISGMLANSGSSTICDSSGDLLFYCYGYDYYLESLAYRRSGIVKSKNNLTMQNGDSLVAEWYHDMLIIPKSIIDSTFYIFTAGVTRDLGLWYNIVDLKLQSGLGEVVQKNIQLQSFPVFDGLTAVKHGNGKDWWLICQRWDQTFSNQNNDWTVYKIDSSGINNISTQTVGSFHNNSGGDLSYNSDGTKLIYCEFRGMIELYDFDRCTGIISNPILIEAEHLANPYPYYASAVFSPNDRFLYLTSYNSINNHQNNYLYQYDLTASNIAASRIIIDSFPYQVGIWNMEIAPDKKIYISAYDEHYSYPFADTVHTNITDNLSVINSPDSLGAACDFQPFSFYLGGRRTYYGLPNNPDYTLGPLVGSPCDTITAIHEINQQPTQNELKVFYHPDWDIAFINADKLTGRKYTFSLFDITGKLIFREQGNLGSQYFTKDLSMQSFAQEVYIATLETDKERLIKRFAK